MEKKGWKIIAIIFIVLLILSTIFYVFGLYSLAQLHDSEEECLLECVSYNSSFYNYHVNDLSCYCYNTNKEIIFSKYIG